MARDFRKTTDPLKSAQFSKLMRAFGALIMKRPQQLQIVKEATGKQCESIAELTTEDMRNTLVYLGVEEGGGAA